MNASLVQKNAIKTALGVALAYAVALALGWQNPVWAAFGVYIPRLPYFGMTFHKSILRVIGTFAGAAVGAAIIGLSAQEHWICLAGISFATGLWFFLARRSTDSYAFLCAGFVGYIVWSSVIFEPQNTFSVASYRISETCLGIVIGALVGALIWPNMELPSIRTQMETLRHSLAQFANQLADAIDGDADAANALSASDAQLRKLLDGIEALFVSANRNTLLGSRLQLHSEMFVCARVLSEHLAAARLLLWEYSQLTGSTYSASVSNWLRDCTTQLDWMDWHRNVQRSDPEAIPPVERFRAEIDHTVSGIMDDERVEAGTATLAVAARDQLDAIAADIEQISRRLTDASEQPTTLSGDEKKIVGTTVPPQPVRTDFIRSIATVLAMFAAGAFWFSIYIPSGAAAFQFAGAVQILLISGPVFPYRQFFAALCAAIGVTFLVVFLVLPRLDGILQLSMVIFVAIYLFALIQEIPGGYLYGFLGFIAFTGLLMVQEQQANYATLLPSFINSVIAQLVGAHISLGVTKLLLPISPGRQLRKSVRNVLSCVRGTLHAAPGEPVRQSPQSQLDHARHRLLSAIDQIGYWHSQLAGFVEKSDSNAIESIAHELRVIAESLLALESCRVAHLGELSEQAREIESELRTAVVSCIDALSDVLDGRADTEPSLNHLTSRVNETATHVRTFVHQQDLARSIGSLSLVGHYRTVTAVLQSLAAAIKQCDFDRLSQNRF